MCLPADSSRPFLSKTHGFPCSACTKGLFLKELGFLGTTTNSTVSSKTEVHFGTLRSGLSNSCNDITAQQGNILTPPPSILARFQLVTTGQARAAFPRKLLKWSGSPNQSHQIRELPKCTSQALGTAVTAAGSGSLCPQDLGHSLVPWGSLHFRKGLFKSQCGQRVPA